MDIRRKLSVAICLVTLLTTPAYCVDCVWDKDTQFPEFQPLIIDSNQDFVLPVLEGGNRIVRIAAGATVTLACPGNVLTNIGQVEAQAVCLDNGLLQVAGSEWDMMSLGCSDDAQESIFRNLGTCGSGGVGDLHGIGFEITSLGLNKVVIDVCFEPNAETTLYAKNTIHGASIAAKDVESSRPSFKSSTGFFSVSMSTVYTQDSQLQLMIDLLGDEGLANTIIDPGAQLYFARGHMSPDADFVIVPNQDATYYYINALPQWQAFNNGNWKYLEYATRDLAIAKGRDLHVYSGGWDVLELDDINGNPVSIYLGLAEGSAVVPAPAVTWKVVHDEASNCAAAVVGVNNPHITAAPAPLCSDLCSQLTWIDFDVNDLAHGYTYCCTVDDLRAAIPHVPNIGDSCLLTS